MPKFSIFQRLLKRIHRYLTPLLAFWVSRRYGIEIDASPIFIVGCPHSGTSLLLSVIGAHSRIHPIPYESGIALRGDAKYFQLNILQFNCAAIAAQKHRWVEKTPQHIRHLSKIMTWIPGAQILLIIRDGRDVAASMKNRYGNVDIGIREWVESNQLGEKFWDKPNVHVIKYEELVLDFENVLNDAMDFLGESYEDAMSEYHATPKRWYSGKIQKPCTFAGDSHEQYRNWQINQPLFNGAGRWKALTEAELSRVYEIGGNLLVKYGYINGPEFK